MNYCGSPSIDPNLVHAVTGHTTGQGLSQLRQRVIAIAKGLGVQCNLVETAVYRVALFTEPLRQRTFQVSGYML